MTKEDLLNELATNTWVMIKPSGIHGIGVFAVRDIPAGCKEMFSKEMGEWTTVPRTEIEALPQHAKDIVENYCLYDEMNYFLPAKGFKAIDLSLFLNHADIPNIISVKDGEYFKAIRDITAGEELFVDYGEIVDGE
ncbi:MAG: SET domain-containing protein [Chitinophagaceae bacterium]|nr:SET domain-containing protein [Chitinophagaceae bacterium]